MTIQFRRGTDADATANNPTLALGEPGYTSEGTFKIGDGSTAWNDLPDLGSGASVLIEELTPGGVSTVTFSSIPATYRHLEIVASVTASVSTNLLLRVNGDTGANYDWQRLQASAASVIGTESIGDTSITVAAVAAAAPTVLDLTVPDYRSGVQKAVTSQSTFKSGTSSGNLRMANYAGWWRTTDVISSLTLLLGAAGNISGSRIALYGRP